MAKGSRSPLARAAKACKGKRGGAFKSCVRSKIRGFSK